ncbi:MAG: hypothetical protein NW208_11680 [Bryobacter sp.]|nr:hypothetical protein [Bryobacter sp.]
MTNRQFRSLLARGHGRAVLFAKRIKIERFEDVVLRACLHCDSLDVQIEGTRASYLFELLTTIRNQRRIKAAVRQALNTPRDNRHTLQHFRLAVLWAKNGDKAFRQTLLQNFAPGPEYGESIVTSLVELDGWEGFLLAARRIGQAVLHNPHKNRVTGELQACANWEFGEERVASELTALASTNRALQAYSRGLQATRPMPEDVRFPGDAEALVQSTNSPDASVQRRAYSILAKNPPSNARDIALQLIASKSPHRIYALPLLFHNKEQADLDLARQLYSSERNREYKNAYGRDLAKHLDHLAPSTEVNNLLNLLYESIPCSHCRFKVVQLLFRNHALPEAYREECRYDANEDIRDIVNTIGGPLR